MLTERIDIVKPLGWQRDSTTLTDMDVKYLLLYFEENYGLTVEKKIVDAITVIANENRYHPVCGFLNSLQWDGQERIRHFKPYMYSTISVSFAAVFLTFFYLFSKCQILCRYIHSFYIVIISAS